MSYVDCNINTNINGDDINDMDDLNKIVSYNRRTSNFNNDEDDRANFDPQMHIADVERLIMERNGFFNINSNSNSNNNNYSKFPNSSNYGEITGKVFNSKNIDQGMPMRGFLDKKVGNIPDIEEQQKFYNPQLDFDLYHSKPKINVSYYDPIINQSNLKDFSEVNNCTQLLNPENSINSIKKISTLLNYFTWDFLEKFKILMSKKKKNLMVTSPFSILAPIIVLYRGSNSTSQLELKRALSFLDKEETFDSFNFLCNKMFKSKDISGSSFILVPNCYPLNQSFVDYSKSLGDIISLDFGKPIDETLRVNRMIYNYTEGKIKNIITPRIFNANTNMILLTTVFFKGQWKNPFLKKNTRQKIFYKSKNDKKYVSMMQQNNKIYNYFEDNENQILEIDYNDNFFVLGLLLPKLNRDPLLSHRDYEYYISQLTPTYIHNICIPRFKQQTKLKINNLFRKMGLSHLFSSLDISEITPANSAIYVSDVIHHSVLIVDDCNYVKNEKKSNSTSANKINFIANHPFIFYVRHKPLNTVLLIGHYF